MRVGTPEFVTWMRARPRPDKVKAYLENGGHPRVVKVRPRKGVRYWKEVVDALKVYAIESVELLDAEGNVLRAMTTEAVEEPDEAADDGVPAVLTAEERSERLSRGRQPDSLVPASVVAAHKETRLVEFARLLQQAYVTGAEQQRDANRYALDALVRIVQTQTERLNIVERQIARERSKHYSRRVDEPEADDGSLEKLLEVMVAGKLQAAGMTPEKLASMAMQQANGAGTVEAGEPEAEGEGEE